MKLHKNFYIALSYLAISFVCMLFLTTASPLYSVNPSPDGNTMFTVGKGLLHGLMPYKDLFDQRGPLIYLMNSVAALISYKSFLGIYIFESITMFIDLFFIFKILNLKYNNKVSFISTFTVIPLMLNSKTLAYGNTPEEYVLPLIFITIYMFTCKSVDSWDKYEYILIGLFMSISFWIKYTLSATWVALCLVLLIYFIYHKYWKKLFIAMFYELVGFAPISLFIIVLYSFKNAVYDLFHVYFYLNLTSYGSTIALKLKYFMFFLLIIAICFLIIYIKVFHLSMISMFMMISVVVFNYLILIKIAWHGYYFEILSFIFMLVPILMCYLLDKYNFLNKLMYIVPVLSLFGIFLTNKNFVNYSQLWNSTNSFIDVSHKNKVPIIKEFSAIINKSKDKTVLTYGRLDHGIYTYAGLVPNDKYFMRNNINYAPMLNAQKKALKLKKDEFVFVEYTNYHQIYSYKFSKDELNILKNEYKVVDSRYAEFENNIDKYVLYQRKDQN